MEKGFLLLLTVTAVAFVQVMPSRHEFDCEQLINVYVRLNYEDCRNAHKSYSPARVFSKMLDNGRVTGQDIIDELKAACSAPLRQEFMNCTQDLRLECPRLDDIITDALDDRLSTYCDIDQPAAWLNNVLQSDVEFNVQCYRRSGQGIEMVKTCHSEMESLDMDLRDLATREPIEEAIEGLKGAGTYLFKCVSRLFNEKIESGETSQCGSSWADLFGGLWMMGFVTGPLGTSLGQEEIVTLMAMKVAEQQSV